MRYLAVKEEPPIKRFQRLEFKPLLGKIRRDKWLELTIGDYRKLTGSRAKIFPGVLIMNGVKQKVASCIRSVNGSRFMYLRAY